MVSGVSTSPCERERIVSAEASEMPMLLKSLETVSVFVVGKELPPIILVYHNLVDMNFETETHKLLQQYFELFGNNSFRQIFTFDDRFVNLGATLHIITLHGQHLLEDTGGSVGVECPHLHLTKTLATKLGFTTQRLLCNKGVGTNGTGMHLVLNQVIELQHVDISNGRLLIHLQTGLAIIKSDPAIFRQACLLQLLLDLFVRGTIKNG